MTHVKDMIDCLAAPLAQVLVSNINKKGGKRSKKRGGTRRTKSTGKGARDRSKSRTPIPEDPYATQPQQGQYGMSPLAGHADYGAPAAYGAPATYGAPAAYSAAPTAPPHGQSSMLQLRPRAFRSRPQFTQYNTGETSSLNQKIEELSEYIDDHRLSTHVPRYLQQVSGFVANFTSRERLDMAVGTMTGSYIGSRNQELSYQYNQDQYVKEKYGSLRFKSPSSIRSPNNTNTARDKVLRRMTGYNERRVRNPSFKEQRTNNRVGNNLQELLAALFSNMGASTKNYVVGVTWYLLSSVIIVFAKVLDVSLDVLIAILNSSSALNKYILAPAIDATFIYMMYSVLLFSYTFVFGASPAIAAPAAEAAATASAAATGTAAAEAAGTVVGSSGAQAAAAATVVAAAQSSTHNMTINDVETVLEDIAPEQMEEAAEEAANNNLTVQNLNVSSGESVPSVVFESDILPELNPKPNSNSSYPFKTKYNGKSVVLERTGANNASFMYKLVNNTSTESSSSVLSMLGVTAGVGGIIAAVSRHKDKIMNAMSKVADKCNYRRASITNVNSNNNSAMERNEQLAMQGMGYKKSKKKRGGNRKRRKSSRKH